MKRVVVIGANGFLGSRLALYLAEHGIEVLGLVFKGSDYKSISVNKRILTVEFDFNSILTIEAKGYDTIFHMAWAGVDSNDKNSAYIQASNITYGLLVIDFARNNSINRIVVPGSASEFSCGTGIISGFAPPAPSDIYSACKVATRYICKTYSEQNNIEFIWALITSIYGPGRNDNNLITYTIKTLLAGKKPSYTGLEQRWDYLFVDDLIYALYLLGEKGKSGMVYPIGSGEDRCLYEYVTIIKNIINPSLPLGIGDLPYKNKHMIDNQVLDVSFIREDTGFYPRYSFEEGIKITIDYFRENVK